MTLEFSRAASDTTAEDSYSVIERLADAIRIEDDTHLSPEDRTRIVQDLYEGPRKCQCCINWVDEVPADAEIDVLEKEDNSHPLVLRRHVMPGEERTQVSIHSIEIRHAATRAVLFDVFKGYDGIVPEVKYLIFRPPFHQFFWRWDRFEKAIEEEEDEYVKTVLLQLRALVKKDLAEAFAVSNELATHGVITHKYLWTLFAPGELIYTHDDGPDQFYIVYSSTEREQLGKSYEICGEFVDWSGKGFGYSSHTFQLTRFEGTRKINDLDVFPAKYMDNYEEVRQRCIERGRKFVDLAGIRYKAYRSAAHQQRSSDGLKPKAQQIDRRIILDAGGHPNAPSVFNLVEPKDLPVASGLIRQAPVDAVPPGGHRPLQLQLQQSVSAPGQVFPVVGPPMPPMPPPGNPPSWVGGVRKLGGGPARGPTGILVPRRSRSCDSLSSFCGPSDGDDSEDDEESLPKKKRFSDEQLQLTSAYALGFCLRDQRWKSFDVNRIHDIEWNTAPFESLVLPEGYKDLILSFVESQLKDGDTFDDVINGKGGGLNILLAGDPGVGKTLTAESVAEKIQAPLYKMELTRSRRKDTADSDSDCSSDEVDDTEIFAAFDRAAKWKAVLLIDECDMYLERRSDASPKRNRLVAKFLQKLEYYPSLLFLTTNRERILDPAIYSRIHLTINYPALDKPSRRTIWKTFLARECESSVTEEQVDRLAEVELNGRRIRNITKTARIMAKRKKRGVCFDDIKHVLRITEGLIMGVPSQVE